MERGGEETGGLAEEGKQEAGREATLAFFLPAINSFSPITAREGKCRS